MTWRRSRTRPRKKAYRLSRVSGTPAMGVRCCQDPRLKAGLEYGIQFASPISGHGLTNTHPSRMIPGAELRLKIGRRSLRRASSSSFAKRPATSPVINNWLMYSKKLSSFTSASLSRTVQRHTQLGDGSACHSRSLPSRLSLGNGRSIRGQGTSLSRVHSREDESNRRALDTSNLVEYLQILQQIGCIIRLGDCDLKSVSTCGSHDYRSTSFILVSGLSSKYGQYEAISIHTYICDSTSCGKLGVLSAKDSSSRDPLISGLAKLRQQGSCKSATKWRLISSSRNPQFSDPGHANPVENSVVGAEVKAASRRLWAWHLQCMQLDAQAIVCLIHQRQ